MSPGTARESTKLKNEETVKIPNFAAAAIQLLDGYTIHPLVNTSKATFPDS